MSNGKEIVLTIKADGKIAVDQLKAISGELAKTGQAGKSASDSLNGTGQTLRVVVETTQKATRETRELGQEFVRAKATVDTFGAAYRANAASMAQALKPLSQRMKETFLDRQFDVRGMAKAFGEFSTQLNQGLEVFQKAGSMLSSALDFARHAAAAKEAKDSFRDYARSVGVDSESMLTKLRAAANGTISDFDLVRIASKAMNLGVSKDADQIGNLLLIARNKARLFGLETSQAFEDIVTGIGRGSPLILDNLGIMIPDALRGMEGGIKSAAGVQAILNATLADGMKQIEDMGGVTDSAADAFRKMESAVGALRKELGESFLPALSEVADFMRTDAIPAAQALLYGYQQIFQALGRASSMSSPDSWAVVPDADKLKDPFDRAKFEKEYYQKVLDFNNNAIASGKYGGETVDKLRAQNDTIKGLINRLDRDMAAFQEERIRKIKQEQKKRSDAEIDAMFSGVDEETLEKAEKEFKAGHKKAQASFKKTADEAKRENDKILASLLKMSEELASGMAKSGRGSRSAFDIARDSAIAATKAAGGFALAIRDGVTELGKFRSISETAFEKAKNIGFASVGIGGGEQKRRFVGEDEIEYKQAIEDAKQAQEDFAKRLRINVADAFSEGLYDAMNGGDFFEAFGRSLKAQVTNAFANSITGSIFGIGPGAGSFDMGSMLFGGTSPAYVGASGIGIGGGIAGGAGGSAGGGGGVGSSGILGGLMGKLFKPVFGANGALNWGALGANLLTAGVVGFGVNRLFGQGGLFGGRVVHGQEQVQISGDLNTQVGQASKQRDELINSLVGVSASTLRELKDLQFAYTWVAKHKSGDGIFSKKTTTYEAVGVAEAQASLAKYLELSEKATAEAAAREFEIAIKQLTNPLEALNMTIKDLSEASARASGEIKQELDYKLKSAQIQKEQAIRDYNSSWFSTRLATGAASAGAIWTPGMESGAGIGSVPPGIRANIRAGSPNHLVQLGLIQAQGSRDYDLGRLGVLAGNGSSETTAYLNARKDYLSDALKTYENLMADAAARARTARENSEEAARAIQEFQAAQNAYYQTKLDQLSNEQQLAAAAKAKQEQVRDDILGTMLTHIGEVSTVGGKQVIVLSAGQPDARDMAIQIMDSLAGGSPELATALGQFIDSYGPRW